jgi:pantothenate kinase
MTAKAHDFHDVFQRITQFPADGRRRLIALAGPPGSGKSTMARRLRTGLNRAGRAAQVVPMDGFHLDNRLLETRGLSARKGAPETFDLDGFASLIARLHSQDAVVFPIFDRARDIAIAGAGLVEAGCEFVIVEGNYLLLDEAGWRTLSGQWDLSVWLKLSLDELGERSINRWLKYGFSPDQARARAHSNDLPNARRAMAAITGHDMEICDLAAGNARKTSG